MPEVAGAGLGTEVVGRVVDGVVRGAAGAVVFAGRGLGNAGLVVEEGAELPVVGVKVLEVLEVTSVEELLELVDLREQAGTAMVNKTMPTIDHHLFGGIESNSF